MYFPSDPHELFRSIQNKLFLLFEPALNTKTVFGFLQNRDFDPDESFIFRKIN